MKSILFINLHPFNVTGGGETFTANTIKSCALAGLECDLVAFERPTPSTSQLPHRLETTMVQAVTKSCAHAGRRQSWRATLDAIPSYDAIWVQQYLGARHTFDVITATAGDQPLLFTSHGHEPQLQEFITHYQPAGHHYFVEVSAYALSRLPAGVNSCAPGAGAWRSLIRPRRPNPSQAKPQGLQLVAIGRILAHKGFEHTIAGLGENDSLDVIGGCPDPTYLAFLRDRAVGKKVKFHGLLSRTLLEERIQVADALVASSTHKLYDGRTIAQPELLGLVLFEAVAAGALPICSDCPAFVEVMGHLGLREWVYKENRPDCLREKLNRWRLMPVDTRQAVLTRATEKMMQTCLWDDYWPRINNHFRLSP